MCECVCAKRTTWGNEEKKCERVIERKSREEKQRDGGGFEREKCEGKKSHFLVCLQCHRKMDSDRNWIFFLLAVSLTFNGILFCGELSQ